MPKMRRTEPTLEESFRDTTMKLLMRRDGVTEDDIRTLLRGVTAARANAPAEEKIGGSNG